VFKEQACEHSQQKNWETSLYSPWLVGSANEVAMKLLASSCSFHIQITTVLMTSQEINIQRF
jgi:hypothetical protein